MGGKSTLPDAVLTDDIAGATLAFDLKSWQGLTQVLKVGKEALAPDTYAVFRDLVLRYAQQGGDPDVRKQIDAIIASFLKKDEPEESITDATAAKSFEIEPEKETEPSEENAQKLEEKSETTSIKNDAPTVFARRIQPKFDLTKKKPEIPVAPPVQEPVVVKDVVEETIQKEVVIPEVDEKLTEAAPEKQVIKTLEEHRLRIAEIKRSVHEQFGNPIALMGLKDDLGKKYMTALLAALKATSAMGSGNAADLMEELENAYKKIVTEKNNFQKEENIGVNVAVQSSLENISSQGEDSVKDDVLSQSQTSADNGPVSTLSEGEQIKKSRDQSSENITIPENNSHNFRNLFKKTDAVISTAVSALHKNNNDEDILDEIPVRNFPNYKKETPLIIKQGENFPQVNNVSPKRVPLNNKYTRKDIAIATNTNEVSSHNFSSAKQAELSSPEVTVILNKILHDWSIFSSSGFFGTGPGGNDHPLYILLAPLNMGEVLSGRWEGSDQKIVKIIKEYVNAWCHEQGMTYTLNETFEHYLRRVAQRIVQRQNASNSAY